MAQFFFNRTVCLSGQILYCYKIILHLPKKSITILHKGSVTVVHRLSTTTLFYKGNQTSGQKKCQFPLASGPKNGQRIVEYV